VLCWLAIVREPVTIDELLALLVTPLSRVQMLEAVDASHRRSLIERGKRPGSFTLQSVVLEYLTAILVAEGSSEIQHRRLDRLIEYSLEQAHAKEYVRQTQERLLLCPLLMDLQSACPRRDEVETQLCSLLDQVREQADSAQGYGPANLIALLRLHRGHLSGLDLSRLAIRGAYLQSVEMHDAKLSGAQIRDSVFTGIFDAISDGRSILSGSEDGTWRLWDGESGQCIYASVAYTVALNGLAWHPSGRQIASANSDTSVALWDGTGETQPNLLHQHRWTVQSVAWSPDGTQLASSGWDNAICIWDSMTKSCVQILRDPDYPDTIFQSLGMRQIWLTVSDKLNRIKCLAKRL